ncbi:hypothetical protein ACMA1D_00935 [Streptomyces sp. 796.1]|uniref:restriction endonuclease-related protein n=1 Tax=Streptomyces sp. 796.1 TaxID=3163029 RepID=UPI0039C94C85
MTEWIAPPPASQTARTQRAITAALRAAYAWSARHQHQAAYRELASMTGVVMEVHGPGHGPVTPHQLVAQLHAPLGELLAFADEVDEVIAPVVLLTENDQLTSDAIDLASEYAVGLQTGVGTSDWLPSWTRMGATRIRRETFAVLTSSKNQDDYVTSRRFLIEHPAGRRDELSELSSKLGAVLPWRGYQELGSSQVHHARDGTGWWWPCPECRWPMAVSHGRVRCRYRPHAAIYRITTTKKADSRPVLTRIDEGPRVRRPKARPAQGSVCLDPGVWRFVVVPGANELRVAQELEKLGAQVALWPDGDSYDLKVHLGTTELRLDLKEYRSAYRLCADLRNATPRARVLLPRTHEHHLPVVRSALPQLPITTETQLKASVRKALTDLKRRDRAAS